MLEVIVGGLLAIAGGFAATFYQTKRARQVRMDERVAENKVIADADAYSHMKTISSMLIQSSDEDVRTYLAGNEDWLFKNRLFLPGRFTDKWLAIRNGLDTLRLFISDPAKKEERAPLHNRLRALADEAIDEIYKDMGLKKLDPENAATVAKPPDQA